MNLDWINGATQKDMDRFKTICNQLLSSTYLVRTIYKPEKGRVTNPDYLFLATHYEQVRDYLSLLDWDLRKDDLNGYFYAWNMAETNRCQLGKEETAMFLALRMMYDENQERLGLEQDAVCTVRDLLEKVVTDYAVLSARPNMKEVKKALTRMEKHALIQRLEGKFNQTSCKFAILPTILAAVPSEKLNEIVSVLQKEEEVENSEESTAD